MALRLGSASFSLPREARPTTDVSLVERFTNLHVVAAPQYEASPAYETISKSHQETLPDRSNSSWSARRGTPRKFLALRAAEAYFSQILRRDRHCTIKKAIEHYKQDLGLCRTYHNNYSDHITKETNAKHLFAQSRGRGLRHWANLAIENVVVPELQRRESEERKIWRAEQRWLIDSQQQSKLQEIYSRRLTNIAAIESEKFSIFGDIGTGVRTAGKEVAEIGHHGARAAQLRAKRIANLLVGRDDDMLFECKRLSRICLERMQASWTILLSHCHVQIGLVKTRALAFNEQQLCSQSRDVFSRAHIMEALMLYEAKHMEAAFSELVSTFDRSVMHKTKEYPPIVSFYEVFGPLTGSALRAAREVTISNGVLYDNSFLKQNKLDLYAADFYDAMKDHLTLLMVDANLCSSTWKEQRLRLSRMKTC